MASEGATDKRLFSIRMPIETIKKAERKYRKEGDESFRDSIIRALEDATRKVALTPDDYRHIAEETENNLKARIAKREAK